MATLYTIGHSTRKLEDFLEILHNHKITCLVDIRAIPSSRFVPWTNKQRLAASLSKEKIQYLHMAQLGGRRAPKKDSINIGWRNAGFRGFADYMQTEDFYLALRELNQLIKKNKHVAMMCAEAVPWRCHRSLISDAEVIRNVKVFHIMDKNSVREHELTDFAIGDKNKKPIQIHYPKKRKSKNK